MGAARPLNAPECQRGALSAISVQAAFSPLLRCNAPVRRLGIVALLLAGCTGPINVAGGCPKVPPPKGLPRLGGDAQCRPALVQRDDGYITFTCSVVDLDGKDTTISIAVDEADAEAFRRAHKPKPREEE